jgi:hypothetical protein
MANWYGTSRSNYVHLKPETIPILSELFDMELHQRQDGMYCIISDGDDVPQIIFWNDEDDEDRAALLEELGAPVTDCNLLDVIHLCLIDDVFVWVSSGAEKARYVTGFATAISPEGEILRHIDLNDIYQGEDWTHAEY